MPAKILSNLEALGDMVGALYGMEQSMSEQDYMEGLIKSAHGKAATAFDLAAAATAKTGRMSHVYEYGVMGITRGTPRFADPTAIEARLYFHKLVGHGGNQDIEYSFRPARQENPKPSPESTGVDSMYLSKLSNRQYYFYNRAYVMETGQVVNIKPKNGNFLFVPFYGDSSQDPTNTRGYMMWDSKRLGPLHSRPGRSSKGDFTKFWLGWWESAGSKMMFAQMEEAVTLDIEIAMAEASKRARVESMKPVQETSIGAAVASAKTIFSKIFKGRSAKRRETMTR